MTNERRRLRILLVHDGVPDSGHVKYLTNAGIDVTDVQVALAVETATTLQPNVIVLDCSADGETVRALKDNPATMEIPVIALVELITKQQRRDQSPFH